MAVGFYLPDEEEQLNSSYQSAVMVSTTNNSATQTPLQSPVSREYLVQAFCEALHRCSIAGSPGILPSPPPSPSCSHPSSNGDIFFPRGSSNHSNIPPATSPSSRMQDEYRSGQWSPRSSISVPRRRYRLSSASDDDADDEMYPIYDDYNEHLQYMAARERLQEFPGRIPPRKKKEATVTNPPTRKTRDPRLWPTVVTAVVLAVGCGFLVSR